VRGIQQGIKKGSVQLQAALLCHQPYEGVMRLPDLLRQFLDIAARQFRIDARLAGILELDLNRPEVNHGFTFPQPLPKS
jgi:hypothetical protein